MDTKRTIIISALVLIFLVGIGGLGAWAYYEHRTNNAKIMTLQKEISNLQAVAMTLASSTQSAQIEAQSASAAISSQELTNREAVVAKSQDQLLTSAVASVAPAVVSIVVSENAPQYQVTYENPFGDDPSFQGLGIRIPVYHQIGTKLQKVGAGTGILFTHDGYIVTNKHVIFDSNAQYAVLLSDGSQKIAQVIYRDPNNDIAIIKIPGTYNTVARIGDSTTLKLGQTVFAVGNALGEYNNSVSVGIISGLNRSITPSDEQGNAETLTGIIQTDAAINPGNSGGPLVDLSGNVVGINVATVQGSSNIAFSIPINTTKNILNKYR